jgi:small subunit ribosomal protein S3
MGQKVNPVGFRVGINREWTSKWYADRGDYSKNLLSDLQIRKFLANRLKDAGVAKIEIERNAKTTKIIIHSSRPGVIIGRQGAGADVLKSDLEKKIKGVAFEVEIQEVRKPDLEARIIADNISRQIEKRMPFRKVAKMATQKVMEGGAIGIKVLLSGRLGGAEIARSDFVSEGKIPLHTFRANISYSEDRAETAYGTIGVKVWIYTGDRFKKTLSEGGELVGVSTEE